jgi:hypothetical protein
MVMPVTASSKRAAKSRRIRDPAVVAPAIVSVTGLLLS